MSSTNYFRPIRMMFLIVSICTKQCNSYNTSLLSLLCNGDLKTQILTLHAATTYEISTRKFCTRKFASNNQPLHLTINSSSSSIPATVRCKPSQEEQPYSTTGFGFIHAHNVIIENIVFENCGATLSSDALQSVNSSDLYYSPHHAAVLLFNHCWNITLTNVTIRNYYGFAVVAANALGDSKFHNLTVTNSVNFMIHPDNHGHHHSVGAGILVHYLNTTSTTNTSSSLSVTNSTIVSNVDYDNSTDHCLQNVFDNTKRPLKYPIFNAAGLTFLHNQHSYIVSIRIEHSIFTGNTGTVVGALLVLHVNPKSDALITVNKSVFDSNENIHPCPGRAFAFYVVNYSRNNSTQSLAVVGSVIRNHRPRFQNKSVTHGTSYAAGTGSHPTNILITLSKTSFVNNHATYPGACMYATAYKSGGSANMVINMSSITVRKNKQSFIKSIDFSTTGLFTFSSVKNINVHGTNENPSQFNFNSGSVFNLIDSDISLNGVMAFEKNSATIGAAISLHVNSHLKIGNNSNASFENNVAQFYGGAIYAATFSPLCSFQLADALHDAFMYFHHNSANYAGNSIYANQMYNCEMNSLNNTEKHKLYDRIFIFSSNPSNNLNNYSTIATSLVMSQTWSKSTLYPGQTMSIPLAAKDEMNASAFCPVSLFLMEQENYLIKTDWSFSHGQDQQVIDESPTNTNLNVTILTNVSPSMSNNEGILLVTLVSGVTVRLMDLEVIECPLGFIFNQHTRSCTCSQAVDKMNTATGESITCNIDTLTITRAENRNFWIGQVRVLNESTFGISQVCPTGYCNSSSKYTQLNRTQSTFNICIGNRNGTLCGKCADHHSVSLGHCHCIHCEHNWYLVVITPAYILLGIMLVLLLFVLKLTLMTGTINGLIFYANACCGGIMGTLTVMSANTESQFLRNYNYFIHLFLSFLNLTTGLKLCAFSGMTEIWKSGLNMIFPILLLLVVGMFVVISRFSVRVSNLTSTMSVQVLVTTVHLSFSKLLFAIIDVYTSAQVYTDNDTITVWYWDGTVKYYDQEHVLLMVIITVIVSVLLIPYVTLLLGAKPLMKIAFISKYFRPVVESIHAPYKDRYQYWFVARLFLLVFIYGIYASFHGRNSRLIQIYTLPLLVVFLVFQAFLSPFKNKVINILDCWLMMNLTLVYLTPWCFDTSNDYTSALIISDALITLVFLTFVSVIIYHIVWCIGYRQWCIVKCTNIADLFVRSTSSQNQESSLLLRDDAFEDSFTGSFSQLREPALENDI